MAIGKNALPYNGGQNAIPKTTKQFTKFIQADFTKDH